MGCGASTEQRNHQSADYTGTSIHIKLFQMLNIGGRFFFSHWIHIFYFINNHCVFLLKKTNERFCVSAGGIADYEADAPKAPKYAAAEEE